MRITCPACGNACDATLEHDFACTRCGHPFPVDAGIIKVGKEQNIDLHIPQDYCSLQEIIHESSKFGAAITNDVELALTRLSATFAGQHITNLGPWIDGARICDIGCGDMPYLAELAENAAKVEFIAGVDLNMPGLRSMLKYKPAGIAVYPVLNTADSLPFPDGYFDCVICSEVLEHTENPESVLQECRRILKQGGMLSLSVPSTALYFYPSYFLRDLWSLRGGLARFREAARDHAAFLHPEKDWKRALTWHPGIPPRVLDQWCRNAGFSILRHHSRLFHYSEPVVSLVYPLLKRLAPHTPLAGKMFQAYVNFVEKLLLNVSVFRWLGTRQFILCRKE